MFLFGAERSAKQSWSCHGSNLSKGQRVEVSLEKVRQKRDQLSPKLTICGFKVTKGKLIALNHPILLLSCFQVFEDEVGQSILDDGAGEEGFYVFCKYRSCNFSAGQV